MLIVVRKNDKQESFNVPDDTDLTEFYKIVEENNGWYAISRTKTD